MKNLRKTAKPITNRKNTSAVGNTVGKSNNYRPGEVAVALATNEARNCARVHNL